MVHLRHKADFGRLGWVGVGKCQAQTVNAACEIKHRVKGTQLKTSLSCVYLPSTGLNIELYVPHCPEMPNKSENNTSTEVAAARLVKETLSGCPRVCLA